MTKDLITIVFGSNELIDTNGILTFIDQKNQIKKELFRIELRSDLQPMITVEIRDRNNQLLGKAYRSTSFVHVHPDYEEIEETKGSEIKRMGLKRKKDNALIFEMVKKSPNEVEINGIFHVKGFPHPIVATRHSTRIGGIILSHNVKVGGGKGIVLTPHSIRF